MCGRNPAHYAEYWKALQELWLRLYQTHLVVIAAINVSIPGLGVGAPPMHEHSRVWPLQLDTVPGDMRAAWPPPSSGVQPPLPQPLCLYYAAQTRLVWGIEGTRRLFLAALWQPIRSSHRTPQSLMSPSHRAPAQPGAAF